MGRREKERKEGEEQKGKERKMMEWKVIEREGTVRDTSKIALPAHCRAQNFAHFGIKKGTNGEGEGRILKKRKRN